MRYELKKYFTLHFGSFPHLSAAEIERINLSQFALMDLHGILYLKDGWKPTKPSVMVPRHILHSQLKSLLSYEKN